MVQLMQRISACDRVFCHVVSVVSVVWVGVWMGCTLKSFGAVKTHVITPTHLAGFGLRASDPHLFNWHPLMMTLAFFFCLLQAILAPRSLAFLPHPTLKYLHAAMHTLGLIYTILGFVAVYTFHSSKKIPHFYSTHSWVGMATLTLLLLQYFVGLFGFLFPGFSTSWKTSIFPVHVYTGVILIMLATITAVCGIMEKLSFNSSCNVSGILNGKEVSNFQTWDCLSGNTLALLISLLSCSFISAMFPLDKKIQVSGNDEDQPLLG